MLFRGETTLEVLRRGSNLGEDEAAVLGEFPEASWAHFQEVMGEDPAHWALPWLNPRTAIEEEEEEQQPAIELHEFTPLKFTPASKRPADQVSPVAGVLWEGVDPSQLDGPGAPLAFPTEAA